MQDLYTTPMTVWKKKKKIIYTNKINVATFL